MRDPERIHKILKIIEMKWKTVPDQRLGQVLFNYFGYTKDNLFYKEDDGFGITIFKEKNMCHRCHTEQATYSGLCKKCLELWRKSIRSRLELS